jgi:hypothetical protein
MRCRRARDGDDIANGFPRFGSLKPQLDPDGKPLRMRLTIASGAHGLALILLLHHLADFLERLV